MKPIEKKTIFIILVNGLILLLTLILLAIFIGIPTVVLPKVETILSQKIHRKVSLGSIKIQLERRGVTLGPVLISQNQDTLLTLAQIEVDLNVIESIKSRSFVFNEVTLSKPHLQLSFTKDSTLSISDLLPNHSRDSLPTDAHTPANLLIQTLNIKQGAFTFTNHFDTSQETLKLGPIDLSLSDIAPSSYAHEDSHYNLHILTPDSSRIHLTGAVHLSPFRVAGELTIDQLHLEKITTPIKELPFKIKGGETSLLFPYILTQNGTEKPALISSNGSLTLRDFHLIDTATSMTVTALKLLTLEGFNLNTGTEKLLAAERIQIHMKKLLLQTNQAGELNLAYLFDFSTLRKTYPFLNKLHGHFKYYDLNIDSVHFQSQLITYDAQKSGGFKEHLTSLHGNIHSITKDIHTPFVYDFKVHYLQQGTLFSEGTGSLFPFSFSSAIVLDSINALPLLEQLFKDQNLILTPKTGFLSGDFKFEKTVRHKGPLTLEGNLTLTDIDVEDIHTNKTVSLPRAVLKGAKIELNPQRIQIDTVTLSEPYITAFISKDGAFSIASPATGKTTVKKQRKPLALAVNCIILDSMTTSFTDSSTLFKFTTALRNFSGSIDGFSLDSTCNLSYEFKGSMIGYSNIHLSGRARPFLQFPEVDLTFYSEGIELSPFSPYAATYAGLTIEDGTVATNLRYHIANDSIWGSNTLILQHVEFGEKVESTKAIDAPFKFGVALLSDRHGNATLHVPISGALNDPNFSLSEIIWKGVGDALAKAIIAPFKVLIKKMQDKNLHFIHFNEGSSKLSHTNQKKLNQVAALLQHNPHLQIEVIGTIDHHDDKRSLGENRVLQEFRQALNIPEISRIAITTEPVRGQFYEYYKEVTGKEWGERFDHHYKHRLTKKTSGDSLAFLEEAQGKFAHILLEEMAKEILIPETDIALLELNRSQVVQSYLIDTHAVDSIQIPIIRAIHRKEHSGSKVHLRGIKRQDISEPTDTFPVE